LDQGTLEMMAASGKDSLAMASSDVGPGDDDVLTAVLKLSQSCEYEAQHTHQVTRLALRLFDELRSVHGLGPRERLWLQYASLLHDIGLIEGTPGHHKASLRIILDSPLLPLDKSTRLLVGAVARYHRGALPRERHGHFARLKPGARRVVRILAAVLRVADGLDYTHQSLVDDLVCNVASERVLVRCTVHAGKRFDGSVPEGEQDQSVAEAERARALEKGDLLEQVFKRKLVIECSPL
jgi:exopolyphosphatase/pppGpp-phosphohydrolase